MRTIPLIRCLPKMSPSSSTSTGSQIATWSLEAIFSMNSSRLDFDLRLPSMGKMFVWSPAFLFLNPARHDILPHRQSQLSDRTIRLHLKSISQKRWLSPNGRFDQFNCIINLSTRSCVQSFFVLTGQNRLQLMSVMTIHKYVNVQASVVGPQ